MRAKHQRQARLSKDRWMQYVAASAAGALTITGSNVDADINYVDVGVFLEDTNQNDGYFTYFGPYTFGASGASLVFQQAYNETGSGEGILAIQGFGNISFAGFIGSTYYFYVSNLNYGDRVSTQTFNVPASRRGEMAWTSGYPNSQFLEAGSGYIGFRFDVGNGTQYGWIEVEMIDGAPGNRAIFHGYAWGEVGEAVTIGVPEPGSLGVLALGSLGLFAWRRKRGSKSDAIAKMV